MTGEHERQAVRFLQRYLLDPPVKVLVWAGLVPGHVLIETRGRRSGRRRRNVVGMHVEGGTGWIVAEQGRHAAYVANLRAHPEVRVRRARQWVSGHAEIAPGDDPLARLDRFGRPSHAAAVRRFGTALLTVRVELGPPDGGTSLLAAGREAEVHLQPDGTVIKLMRDPTARERVEREASVCRLLAGAGHLAPEVHGVTTVDGRPGLVMERIDSIDLLTALRRRPHRVLTAAAALARAHARMHACTAPPELPDLHDELAGRIRGAPLPSPLAEAALAVLATLPRGDRVCHGDYHLGNVLGPWDRPVVIDWAMAARGEPVADVARTDLLHRIGALPDGAPAPFRALARLGRRLVAHRYLTVYDRYRQVDRAALERWRFVHAAARAWERIPAEREVLLGVLRDVPERSRAPLP